MVAVGEQADRRPGVGDGVEIEPAVEAAQHLQGPEDEADDAQHDPEAGEGAPFPLRYLDGGQEHRRGRDQGKGGAEGVLRGQAERQAGASDQRRLHRLHFRPASRQLAPDALGQGDQLQDRDGQDQGQDGQRPPRAFGRAAGEHPRQREQQQRQAGQLHRRQAEGVGLAGPAEQPGDDHQSRRRDEQAAFARVAQCPAQAADGAARRIRAQGGQAVEVRNTCHSHHSRRFASGHADAGLPALRAGSKPLEAHEDMTAAIHRPLVDWGHAHRVRVGDYAW